MIANWICEENLKPLLEVVSTFIGYSFDDSDWTAISEGIKNTNVEQDRWYDYALIADQTVKVKIAEDVDAGLIFVQLESEKDIEAKAEVAIGIFQEYTVK